MRRQSSIINRKFIVFTAFFLLLSPAACTRAKAQKELRKNHFFAEVLKREDRRELGEDGFFRDNLLGNPYLEVRQWCAAALGRIAAPQALPWLYEAVRGEYAAVRAASAFAIGEIEGRQLLRERNQLPDPRSSAELTRLLDDTSLAVRMRAVEALGKIGGPGAAAEIVRRLDSFSYGGFPAQRVCLGHSITALGRLKDPVAALALEKLAGSADPEIRDRAEEALARLRAGPADPLRNSVFALNAGESPLTQPRITDTIASVLAASRKNSTIAILETARGVIEIELYRELAPATTAHFVLLASGGRLDGTELARAGRLVLGIKWPNGAVINRPLRPEINMAPFERGSVGMALSGGDSRTPAFFIALAPQPYLDGVHTCFGRVISGIQVAEKTAGGDRIKQVRVKETISFHNRLKY